jgi:O-acetylhomoserine/O-acetylserine sulfhydrylase-like pyridoxal-dependent enzyme
LLNIAHGANIVIHSDNKIQAMAPLGGVIIDSGTFDWVVVVS